MIKLKTIIFTIIMSLFMTLSTFCQSYNLNKNESTITVSGTSSLHDWDIISNSFEGNITFKNLDSVNIDNISIKIEAKTLKSGKKSMDKNTYKALKVKQYNYITYQSLKINSITKLSDSNYRIKSNGVLSVAGESKTILITFLLSKTKDRINITGSKAINMTDYGIEPPKALLGAITTGDQIAIKFNTLFKTNNI